MLGDVYCEYILCKTSIVYVKKIIKFIFSFSIVILYNGSWLSRNWVIRDYDLNYMIRVDAYKAQETGFSWHADTLMAVNGFNVQKQIFFLIGICNNLKYIGCNLTFMRFKRNFFDKKNINSCFWIKSKNHCYASFTEAAVYKSAHCS